MIRRASFFETVRGPLFGGSLSRAQVANIEAILNWVELNRKNLDPRWLAYALATAYHETDRAFGPIAEYGKGGGKLYGLPSGPYGHIYYGRGLVQLTWEDNYKRLGPIIGEDLHQFPDRALALDCAIPIMFEGMERGLFTGKKFSDYFNDKISDPLGARRIINGTDKRALIANYYATFLVALKSGT